MSCFNTITKNVHVHTSMVWSPPSSLICCLTPLFPYASMQTGCFACIKSNQQKTQYYSLYKHTTQRGKKNHFAVCGICGRPNSSTGTSPWKQKQNQKLLQDNNNNNNSTLFRGIPTRMVYLYYISCLRYTILDNTHAWMHVHEHPRTHTCTHTHTQTYTHTHTMCTHTHKRIHIHTQCVHTHTHTNVYTYTHNVYTHTHTKQFHN